MEEISAKANEKVEVLDSSKNWWYVRSKMGARGFLPSTILELIGGTNKQQTGLAY